jgi:hypothetical protein
MSSEGAENGPASQVEAAAPSQETVNATETAASSSAEPVAETSNTSEAAETKEDEPAQVPDLTQKEGQGVVPEDAKVQQPQNPEEQPASTGEDGPAVDAEGSRRPAKAARGGGEISHREERGGWKADIALCSAPQADTLTHNDS